MKQFLSITFFLTSICISNLNAQYFFESKEGKDSLKSELAKINSVIGPEYKFKIAPWKVKIKDISENKTYYLELEKISVDKSSPHKEGLMLKVRNENEYPDNLKKWMKKGGINRAIIGDEITESRQKIDLNMTEEQAKICWEILKNICLKSYESHYPKISENIALRESK